MKGAIVVCLFALAAVTMARPDGSTYTSKYDYINVSEIVENDRLFIAYCNCILDKGKCTPEGLELKSHITDALQTHCAKCTPTQRRGTNEVIGHMINKKPEVWTELKNKYDPKGIYAKKYEDELRAIKQ